MPYNFPNEPATLPRLDTGINDTVTTLDVDNWTYHPADTPGDFVIRIDDEYMFVGARVGDTLSGIVRNSEEPGAAAAHLAGSVVRCVLTRDAILDIAASVSPVVLFDRVVVPGGGAASITFSAIPSTHENLRLTLMGRTTQAATSTLITLTFNGDGGANYDYQQVFGVGVAEDANSGAAATSLPCGTLSGSTAPAGVASQSILEINGYARSIFQKAITMLYGTKVGIAAANSSVVLQGWWRNTAVISSIVLTPASGNFAEGTVASLYGIA